MSYSFYGTDVGQLVEVMRILAKGGITPKDIESIMKEPAKVKEILKVIRGSQSDNYPKDAKHLTCHKKARVYGSQDPLLLQSQDGETNPYQDNAELYRGDDLGQVSYFDWVSGNREVFPDFAALELSFANMRNC